MTTPPGEVAPLTADANAVGTHRRVATRILPLATEPSQQAPVASNLARHAVLRVDAATGSWYRVSLPDGGTGYVPAKSTETVGRPIRRVRRESQSDVLDRPLATAAIVERVAAGADIAVYGRHEGFLYVRTPGDRAGWLEAETR